MNTTCKLFGLALLSTLCFGITKAQTSLTDKLPFDSTVVKGKLANGLTYYIKQNKRPENKVELRLAVNAGSILEDNDQQGLAHFTEHMAFNGSTHFKKNELVSYLQTLGIEFGADLNAYTSFDETIYILPVPLSDPANLEKGMQVLQDWAGGLSYEASEIDAERNVVLEESRMGKGADDRIMRKIYPRQYAGSKYAVRLPIGKDSILKTFKYDAARRFYKTWYRPNLMAVLIVGDIDVAKAATLVHQYFDTLKNPVTPKTRVLAPLVPRQKSEAVVVTDKEATNFITEIDYTIKPEKEDSTLGDYRQTIIKQLFTTMLNQRLSEKTQVADPPYLFAGTGFNSYARGYEGFIATTAAGSKGPDTALHVMLSEINRARVYGFGEDELDRAKKQLLAGMEKLYNDRSKTESSPIIEELIRNFLTGETVPGIAREYNYYKDLLPGISLAEIQALNTSIKQDAPLFISLQGPDKSGFKLPTGTQLLAQTQKWMHEKPVQVTEKKVAASLMEKLPEPGTITAEKQDAALGTTEITFANGAKVILKPTEFKNDEISLSSFHKGGASWYDAPDVMTAGNAATIVQTMGVGDFSPVDLRKVLAGKVAGVSPRIGNISAGISGSSSVKDVETMLQLGYLYLTQPRKDEALFNGWKASEKASVQYALANPSNVFVDTFYQVLYQNNPLAQRVVPRPHDFDAINLDRAIEIYKERLGDATDFTFIMVGNIDTATVIPLLARYIGSLPGSGKPAAFKDNGVRLAKGHIKLNINKGTEQKSLIVNCYNDEIPFNEDLDLKTQALCDILNIKITEDLREKMGGIYGGSISGGVSKYPYSNYSLVLELPCGPENVTKLQQAFAAELDSIKTMGPEQKNLDKVKKTWIEKYKVQLKENGFWLGVIQSMYYQGNDAKRVFTYEQRVNAITIDDIKQTANLLFNNKNVIEGVLNPEKKK
ncbi:M16 family metallopeptidase [Deminuibacter soli]|uniref:Insulinase family protein n=1 Tax=Deminuibacter soli TaxID=2291815 RepID=A0A3E1NLV0_9BACT|nr:M16 family metallopeptidase [Deminuibacter soli]RFM28871.1 insulinase family protein [Deminuibacter soli]